MAKKQIQVNQTDVTVPSADDVPEVAQLIASEAPAASAAQVIEAAEQADDVQAWEQVADLLYELEHKKHTLPGLMQSRLGRLLERLP